MGHPKDGVSFAFRVTSGLGDTPHPPPPTPHPSTLTARPCALNSQASSLNPHPYTIHPQPSTLNPQLSSLNPGRCSKRRRSILSPRHSGASGWNRNRAPRRNSPSRIRCLLKFRGGPGSQGRAPPPPPAQAVHGGGSVSASYPMMRPTRAPRRNSPSRMRCLLKPRGAMDSSSPETRRREAGPPNHRVAR